ncbi:hypothetical protein GJAV_G00163240 [Gymnothorax javanicus]|nr:hypothetical protein GJAV_G00163240 [Gymnothorax javanicus]
MTKETMTIPTSYFIFYILGLQLISGGHLDGPTKATLTESQQPNNTSTSNSTSRINVAPGAVVNKSYEGNNISTTSKDGYNSTEAGISSTTVEMIISNNGSHELRTSDPKLPTAPNITPDEKPTLIMKSDNVTVESTVHPNTAPHRGPAFLILVILLFIILVFLFVIYILHKKSKRYSFDLNHKVSEEASIPLNTMDQEGSFLPALPKEDYPGNGDAMQGENIASNITEDLTLNRSPSDTIGPISDHDDDDCSKPPSEDSFGSQVLLSPKDGPGTFTMDMDLNTSNHTSVESLREQQNENNNNTATGDAPCQASAEIDHNKDFAEIYLDEIA